MHRWSRDMVRWMRHAAEYGDYYQRLAAWMRPHLRREDHLCDAGCGLGSLSLALSPYIRCVTAADRSAAALSELKTLCAARPELPIRILAGDLAAEVPAKPYDAMVFCFFGDMEQIAAIARAQCRGWVFVFKRNYAHHRFCPEKRIHRGEGFPAAVKWLCGHGVPFAAETMEVEFGQPFRSWEDARRFFLVYRRGAEERLITDEFLQSRVVETGRQDFPLYLPHKRPVGCLRFFSGSLPAEYTTGKRSKTT